MNEHDSGSPFSSPQAADRAARIRRVAGRVWDDLRQYDVLPTPRNFELWFTSLDGSNPSLSAELSSLLKSGTPPTAQQLRALYSEYLVQRADVDSTIEQSERLDDAAQGLGERLADIQASLRSYGETLSGMSVQIDQTRTMDGLLQAVNTLSAETARASERNRVLEQQLAASAGRIAKLRQDLASAKQDAATDGLTGLPNRRAFDGRLRRAITRARAEGEPLSLIMLDIDHFKRFNDTFGHHTGDLVLRLVARLISDNVKGRDTAARYGGEEFAIVLTGAGLAGAAIVAGQMRALLDGKRLIAKGAHRDLANITISAGVAEYRPSDSAASLIARADVALYEAKRGGRNQVCTEEAAESPPG